MCQCVCKIPTPQLGIREEGERYAVNFIRESSPSVTADVAWTAMCLVLPQDRILTAMQAGPEIQFDLHGLQHLIVDDVHPSLR